MSIKKGIHVVGVEVSNFHRIKFARVVLDEGGRVVRVTGKNRAGKTSLLRSIRAALGGAGEVLPASVNDESEEGVGIVKLELSNGFTVMRKFTEANPKGYLTVEGPDGGKHPQSKLNGWLGRHSFDPLAFFDLKPARQRQILLSLGTDPELASKLSKVKVQYDALFEARTPFIAEQRRARAVTKPDGERPEAVDVSAEMEKLRALQEIERDLGDKGRVLADFRAKLGGNKARQGVITAQVTALREELADVEEDLASHIKAHDTLMTDGKKAKAAFEAVTDPSAEIEAITDRLSEADIVNARLEPWKRWDTAAKELADATELVEEATLQLKDVKADEAKLIAEAGIPVEGLSFDENAQPLLNGRPLVVASGAERISLSVAVAQAVDPELKVCLVDEANDLDLEALEALDQAAKDSGFQVWACRLGLEGEGEIIVENGYAKSAGEPITDNRGDDEEMDAADTTKADTQDDFFGEEE